MNSDFGAEYEEYRFEFEDQDILRFFLDRTSSQVGPFWRVLSKDHQWSTFGAEAADQLRGPTSGGDPRIYRWHISEQTDTHGNSIAYSYKPRTTDSRDYLYLEYIYYNCLASRVVFRWCDSPPCRADLHTDFSAGFPLDLRFTLADIKCEVWDPSLPLPDCESRLTVSLDDTTRSVYVQAEQYTFEYTRSHSSGNTLLTSISDGGMYSDTVIPATNFSYTGQDDTLPLTNYGVVPLQAVFTSIPNYDPFAGPLPTGNYKQYFMGDFNGDGCDDVLHVIGGGPNHDTVAVWLGRPDGSLTVCPPISMNGESLAGVNLGAGYGWIFRVADFNGDGMDDVFHVNTTSRSSIWLSRKDAQGNFNYFDVRDCTGPAPACSQINSCSGGTRLPICFPDDEYRNPYAASPVRYAFQIADFNGDGKADILTYYRQTEEHTCPDFMDVLKGRMLVYFSRGTGVFDLKEFEIDGATGWPYDFSLPPRGMPYGNCGANQTPDATPRQYGAVAADVNNDGLADILHPKCPEGVLVAFLNKGTVSQPANDYDIEFERTPCTLSESLIFAGITDTTPVKFLYGDFNGDGILDFVNANNYIPSPQYHLLSSRNNWTSSGTQFDVTQLLAEFEYPALADYIVPADFDGDRFTDFAVVHVALEHRNVWLYRNMGDGRFGYPYTTGQPNGNYIAMNSIYSHINPDIERFLFGDFNGDGKTDYINLYPGHLDYTVSIASNASLPDQLAEIRRGDETIASVTYASGRSRGDTTSGIPVSVVSSLQKRYLGDSSTSLETENTDYSYRNGVYDHEERQFLGFGEVVISRSTEDYIKRLYNTDRARQGRIATEEKYVNNVKVEEDVSTWATLATGPSTFVFLQNTTNTAYGSAGNRSSSVAYTYDNVHHGTTQIVRSGTDAVSVTENFVWVDVYQFNNVPNGPWLWREWERTTSDSENGTLKHNLTIYYDTGDPHYLVEYISDTSVRTTVYTWNPRGNLASESVSGMPTITYTYDNAEVFPSAASYSTSQGQQWVEHYGYDRRSGLLVSFTDRNNKLCLTFPDGHRRYTSKTAYDGPSQSSPLAAREEFTYTDASLPTSIASHRWTGNGGIDSIEYRLYWKCCGSRQCRSQDHATAA